MPDCTSWWSWWSGWSVLIWQSGDLITSAYSMGKGRKIVDENNYKDKKNLLFHTQESFYEI